MASDAAAQGPVLRVGVHAAGVGTRVDPSRIGESRTEGYIVHPMLMARASAWRERLAFTGTLNLEGWTVDAGSPAPGNSGEGWIDRRHPHAFLHEAIVTLSWSASGVDASLSAGRGFAPFGTDDPMVRPFLVYPANHHWAQILERIVVIGALRHGPLTIEAGVFNGDEPNRPEDLGRLSRAGDSRAARVTIRPRQDLEFQLSRSSVESPEHVLGGGLDQRKWSASARWTMDLAEAGDVYAFIEWAETGELASGRVAFVFTTVLAEASLARGPWRIAGRYERTTRPEEERLFDPFRSARPHGDENIIGATRWNTVTLAASRAFPVHGVELEPFAEAALSDVREITGAIFDPLEFFGSERITTLSFGVRLRAGLRHSRMGRYGVAAPEHHQN
ncbi:MAG: hypothetical protein L0271_17970 [Gemmatimonadetes bacterium]|nr:hypothetical protein [Gemmatimonadota bacterium]